MEEGEESQVDPDIIFKPLPYQNSEIETENDLKSPKDMYADGKVLPKALRDRFARQAKPGTPLQDIDPYYHDKQTFVVIGRWGRIHRYSDNPNNFLFATLGPHTPLRKFAIYLESHWLFTSFIAVTLLINIAALVTRIARKDGWQIRYHMTIVDYICLSVYCFEFGLKLVSRGLTGQFSGTRDPWIWLDAFVIFTGFYVYLDTFILSRWSIPWVRIFKLIPLVPSVREAFRFLLKAVKNISVLLIPIVLLVWFFSLLATQLYMGTLSQKCLKRVANTTIEYERWYWERNFEWYRPPGDNFTLCGNASGASTCPKDFVCLRGFYQARSWGEQDDNTPYGIDNVQKAIVSVVRIASQDFTDGIYRQLISANGSWHILFFVAIFALVTFPVGCLFYAFLGNFFLRKQISTEFEKKLASDRVAELDIVTSINDQEEEEGFFAKFKARVNPDWIRGLVICVMLVDILGILYHFDGENQSSFMTYFFKYFVPSMVVVVYSAELLLADGWNTLDIIILLTLIPQAFQVPVGRTFSPIRLLKLSKFWSRLKMIFTVYCKTARSLCGWIILSIIVLAFFVLVGRCKYYQYNFYGDHSIRVEKSRWRLVTIWNSFRVIIRMMAGEWYQTLMLNQMDTVWTFYAWVNLCGALLMGYLLAGVVHVSLGELRKNGDNFSSSTKGLRHRLNKLLVAPFQKLFKLEHIEKLPDAAAENVPTLEDGEDGNEDDVGRSNDESPEKSKIQALTEHRIYNLVCIGLVAVASIAQTLESNHNRSEYWQLGLFIVEVVFTIAFLLVVILELTAHGFKLAISSRSGIMFDCLIVLENILNLAIYQLSLVNGEYRVGIFWLRSFRPLMLISRVDHLKAAFRGIRSQLTTAFETVLAIFFIWVIFDAFAVHSLAGLFYKCVNLNTNREMLVNKKTCQAVQNGSWENSNLNFDNAATGFISMALLAATGWIYIINDATDAVGHDMARERDHSKLWLIYFCVFLLVGVFGTLGILFSEVFHKFKENNGCQILMTDGQAKKYAEAKDRKSFLQQSYWLSLENYYIPRPESSSSQQLVYKFATNRYFDGVVMVVIIVDLIILSVDFYRTDDWPGTDMLFYCWNFIVIIYAAEMVVKLIAWRHFYFRSWWNLLDMVIVLPGVCGLIFIDTAGNYAVVLRLLRILRLPRILRFVLAKEWGLHTVKKFVSAFSNAKYALGNLVAFQTLFMVTFAILGTYLFDNVEDGVRILGDQINFRTFWASLRTLTLLVVGGLPALDGLYSGLGNEKNCEDGVCGNKITAVVYIGMYVGLTFYVLLNMYAVMITEIMWEFERGKNASVVEKIEMEEVVDNENISEISNLVVDD